MTQDPRLRVVLCTSGGLFGALVLRRLLASERLEVVAVVKSTRVLRPSYGWLRGALEQLRRSGPVYAAYLGWATTGAEWCGRLYGISPVQLAARRRGIPVRASRDVNQLAERESLAGLRPDLLLSAFFNQRLGAPLCAVAAGGAVNIHPSLLPQFRGVDPVFFARLRGAAALGVTLHRVAEEFDTGQVLRQEPVPIAAGASVFAATAALFGRGAELFLDALPDLAAGVPGTPQAAGGSYDSWPTPAQVAALRASGQRLARWRDLGAAAAG